MTPRNQNAKAYVNGAMMASVDVNDGTVSVIEPPRIVLGGISGTFFHAEATENYLVRTNGTPTKHFCVLFQ